MAALFGISLITLFAAGLTLLLHYHSLMATARLLHHPRVGFVSLRIYGALALLMLAHLLEVLVYAIGIEAALRWIPDSALAGAAQGNFGDAFYYSLVGYTSLGLGDVYAIGPLRYLIGIEALNGLLMLTWSASCTYLCLRAMWEEQGFLVRSHRK